MSIYCLSHIMRNLFVVMIRWGRSTATFSSIENSAVLLRGRFGSSGSFSSVSFILLRSVVCSFCLSLSPVLAAFEIS